MKLFVKKYDRILYVGIKLHTSMNLHIDRLYIYTELKGNVYKRYNLYL